MNTLSANASTSGSPATSKASPIIRIANCSGFYGDKLSAARDMVEGGPIDVLTGDYLAELTMSILHNKRQQDATTGYVGTFLKQLKEVVATCLERNIKIVTNAGGLNPEGMAAQVQAILDEQGLTAKVAWIDGDNLMPRIPELQASGNPLSNIDTGQTLADSGFTPLTANAYLGAWGIKEALDQGADIVICPRVTDASVVMGPAAWKHGWQRDNYDALAGALVAGHLIECGPGVTGGNYSFFQEVPSFHDVGFPIAEIEASGNFTITKHRGTGGLVSVGTVTAQTLYEINAPSYLNPDVTGHFDSFSLTQTGPDRVYISGCKGSAPPATHKVCINLADGHRCSIEMPLTGLDIEQKAAIFSDALFYSVGGRDSFKRVTEQLLRKDKANPASNDEAVAILRIIVESDDPQKVGRLFYAKVTELAIANYPGLYGLPAATGSGPIIRHWPALIDSQHIVEAVHLDGKIVEVLPSNQLNLPEVSYKPEGATVPKPDNGATASIHLGRLLGTRSGDKGGCANLGVWAKTDAAYSFLYHQLTVEKLKTLLPDMQDYVIDRYDFPNIKAVNFYIRGVLGDGIAASTRTDGQAKSLGEYLGAKLIDVPQTLVDSL